MKNTVTLQGKRELKFQAAALLAVSMTASMAAIAHEGATGAVKERMDGMKAIGQQVKIMVPMMKGTLPYEPEKVAQSAGIIESHAGENFTSLFPEGSHGKPSEALDDIWTDWSKFSDLATDLQTSARALKTVAVNNGSEDAFKGALGTMLRTCKSCHIDFRK
jgi:cytochrome c556